MEFLAPALFDWAEKLVFTMGLTMVSSLLPVMIRGLVPPTAGYMSYILFGRKFSWAKLTAILLACTGVTLGCMLEVYNEAK